MSEDDYIHWAESEGNFMPSDPVQDKDRKITYEVKQVEKGFMLTYRGIEIGVAKLHCDAVLIAKMLDNEFNRAINEAVWNSGGGGVGPDGYSKSPVLDSEGYVR